MSRIMDIAAASSIAYQRALATISDNIANANVEGYARRTAEIGASSATTLDPQFPDASLRACVTVTRITRWQDDLKSDMARTALSEKARLDTRLDWMRDVEAFTSANGGLSPMLLNLRDAISDLALSPQAPDARAAFLAQADALAQALVRQRQYFDLATEQVELALQNTTSDLNDSLQNLARTNDNLRRALPDSSQWAEQADQRDRLLQKIAGLIDIQCSLDDKGCATVLLAHDPTRLLVRDTDYFAFSIDRHMQLWHDPYGTPTAISAVQGKIAGLLQATQYIAARATNMDDFAHRLVADFNMLSQQAINARGMQGGAIFSLDVEAPASQLRLAGLKADEIGTAAPWVARSHAQNRGTATLILTPNSQLVDPAPLPRYEIHILSPSTAEIRDPATGAVVGNVALPMSNAQNANGFSWILRGDVVAEDRFTIGPPGPNPSDISALTAMRTWLEKGEATTALQQEVNDMAFATASTQRMAKAADTVATHALAAVENSRGVNIDEETIALEQLQKAYAASARILQTAQDIFDNILRVR